MALNGARLTKRVHCLHLRKLSCGMVESEAARSGEHSCSKTTFKNCHSDIFFVSTPLRTCMLMNATTFVCHGCVFVVDLGILAWISGTGMMLRRHTYCVASCHCHKFDRVCVASPSDATFCLYGSMWCILIAYY